MLSVVLGDSTMGARPWRGGLSAPCLPAPCEDLVWSTSSHPLTECPGTGCLGCAWGLLGVLQVPCTGES